jgi:hypothetical protein
MEGNSTADDGTPQSGPKAEVEGPLVYGSLEVKRYLKDDHRALILYTLREPAKT